MIATGELVGSPGARESARSTARSSMNLWLKVASDPVTLNFRSRGTAVLDTPGNRASVPRRLEANMCLPHLDTPGSVYGVCSFVLLGCPWDTRMQGFGYLPNAARTLPKRCTISAQSDA
jgi:hypothetical protein